MNLNLRWMHWVRLLAISSFVWGLDRVSKTWAARCLPPPDPMGRLRFIDLKYWENTGIVFGSFEGSGRTFVPLSLVALVFLFFCYKSLGKRERMAAIGIALLLGGALGNLYDRIHQDYVIDFIYLRIWPFPFNVADCGITVGLILFLTASFLDRGRSSSTETDEHAPHTV